MFPCCSNHSYKELLMPFARSLDTCSNKLQRSLPSTFLHKQNTYDSVIVIDPVSYNLEPTIFRLEHNLRLWYFAIYQHDLDLSEYFSTIPESSLLIPKKIPPAYTLRTPACVQTPPRQWTPGDWRDKWNRDLSSFGD